MILPWRETMPTTDYTIEPLMHTDKGWVLEWVAEQWFTPQVVAHDQVYQPHQLPGFAARRGGEPQALVTYTIDGKDCEIVTINSRQPNHGLASALIEAVEKVARQAGCRRVWLVTTNDNLHALAFTQKRGFRICRVDPGAVDRARRIKPDIPQVGEENIPLHDELQLEKVLG
jgi:GNAT superfamily N-acetyltransferase